MKEYRQRNRFQDYLYHLQEPNDNHLPVNQRINWSPLQKTCSTWRDTRLFALFSSFVGLITFIVAFPYFQSNIQHPVLLNLILLVGIAGFANIAFYPYQVERNLSGIDNGHTLSNMRWCIIGFLALVGLFL